MIYGQILRNPPRGYVPVAPLVDRALIPPKPKPKRQRKRKTAPARVLATIPAAIDPLPVLEISNDRLIMRQVLDHVARITGLSAEIIVGRSRAGYVTLARSYVYYLCRDRGDYSLPRLGKFFGDRHHTTVLSGCRAVEAIAAGLNPGETLEAVIVSRFRFMRALFFGDMPQAARE